MTASLGRIGDQVPAVGKGGANITPDDSIPVAFAAVYVGGLTVGGIPGDVTCTGLDRVPCTFYSCPVGFVIPMAVVLVAATGTTATKLTGIR